MQEAHTCVLWASRQSLDGPPCCPMWPPRANDLPLQKHDSPRCPASSCLRAAFSYHLALRPLTDVTAPPTVHTLSAVPYPQASSHTHTDHLPIFYSNSRHTPFLSTAKSCPRKDLSKGAGVGLPWSPGACGGHQPEACSRPYLFH